MAVTLLYELGEGAPEEALKPGSGALGQLALATVASPGGLPCARHRLVALAVMECTVRYVRVFASQQAAIPAILEAFLDSRGLANSSPDVATRACYLFARLVKALRANLKPFLSQVLVGLQPRLVAVATVPPPGGDATGTRDTGGGKAAGAAASSFVDDRLYVFEAVGLLLGQEDLPAEQQAAALSSLLQPLMLQIESNLQPAAAALAATAGHRAGSTASSSVLSSPAAAGGGGAVTHSSWLILQAMESVSRLSKGFKSDLLTRSRSQLGEDLGRVVWGGVAVLCHRCQLLLWGVLERTQTSSLPLCAFASCLHPPASAL